MQKRLIIPAAALALPAIAVMAWMLTPAPQPPAADGIPPGSRASAPGAASQSSRTTVTAPASRSGTPGIVRRSDEDFPELTPAPAAAPVLSTGTTPGISSRYTLNTQPNAASLARRLANHPALQSDERIRVVPAEAGSPGTAASGEQPAPDAGAVVLKLDATLHDPVAWLENEKPLNETQANVKAKIAGEFAAAVATAAKQPETADKPFDDTWKDARAKANREYQKFYGDAALNRAGLNAGRAAVSRQ